MLITMKLSEPKVINDNKIPLTPNNTIKQGIKTILGILAIGCLYVVIIVGLIFAVGFAICSYMQ